MVTPVSTTMTPPQSPSTPKATVSLDELEEAQHDLDVTLDTQTVQPLTQTLARIPELINREHVVQMIDFQVNAIDKLEGINKSLTNCNIMAQNKLSTTTKLFKKTAKQMTEAKRDLDIIYQKIINLKNRINAEKQQTLANSSAAQPPQEPASDESDKKEPSPIPS